MAVFSEEDLVIRGRLEIRSLTETGNVSIHTNGDLITRGQAFLVEGYGSYSGEADTEPTCLADPMLAEDELRCNFNPKDDWNEEKPNVFWNTPVTVPEIDVVGLLSAATLAVGGDYVIDGETFPFDSFSGWAVGLEAPGYVGTADKPFVLVVDGDLTIRNAVHLSGYGIMLATGNLFVVPNGSGGGAFGSLAEWGNTMLLAGMAGIDIGAGAGVVSTLYSTGEIRFGGAADVTGGILTRRVNFGAGRVAIQAAAPREAITPPGFNAR